MELNKIYLEDCLSTMNKMDSDSIHFIVTSPPYYNLREYAQWDTYEKYLEDVDGWFKEMVRILQQGRHICWNIQDNLPDPSKEGRHYYALMPDTIKIAQKYGLEWERNIIWNKNHATQVMFGSFPFPPNIIYSCITESICVFRKWGKSNLSGKSEESKIKTEEWNKYKNNLWNIGTCSHSEHPAPFPLDIPLRCIQFHSFVNDVVYDPFSGSGTTAVACKISKRKWIGSEIKQEYVDLANERLRIIRLKNEEFF